MQSSTLGWLDYVVVIGYMLAMAWMGFFFSKRQEGTDKYYAGGRRIPAWAIGMSILATLISSVTFLAYPGTGYGSNWLLLVQGLMVPLVLLCLIWFIVPAYRKAIGISAYEYFEKRFSYGSRLYTSLAFSVMHFTKMGSVIYLLAAALASMVQWNLYAVILVVGVVTILYTLVGGIEAVVWTDVVQGFLFLAGAVLCIAILLFLPDGGPGAVVGLALDNNKIDFGPYTLDFHKRTFIVLVINGMFYAFQKYATDQTIVQRFLLAKDDKAAIKSTLIGALLCVPTWTIFMFIGTCLWAFYKLMPQLALPEGIKADQVFPHFIMTQLPMGVTGLVLAALLAAAMSTLASDLNCLSAVFVEDYYRRWKKNTTDAQRLFVGKGVVLACGVIALLIACIYAQLGADSILGTIFELYAIFSGGVVGLFALAFFTRRANKQGVLVGIAVCVAFTAWAVLSSQMKWGTTKIIPLDSLLGFTNYPHYTHDSYMLGVYSHLVMFFVGYAASLLWPASPKAENLTIFGWLKKRHGAAV